MKLTAFIAAVGIVSAATANAAAQQYDSEQIRQALRSGADYLAEVVLHEQGYSRGDYNWNTGQWQEYEPAWHTGQATFALLEAHRHTQDNDYLAHAKRAGDWWVSLAYTDHPKLRGYLRAVHGGPVGDYINFTTIADGSAGLFLLSQRSGDSTYADIATSAGDWAIQHLYLANEGLLYNIVDPNSGEVWTDKSPHGQHNSDGKVTLHEAARPNNEGYLFYDMYQHTQNPRHRQVFVRLCGSLVEKQDAQGWWLAYEPNNPATGKLHPRFNLWYAESLLKCFALQADQHYLNAATQTARAMQALQGKDGEFYYFTYTDGRADKDSITGSAVSFAGILWLALKQISNTSEFDLSIAQALDFVMKNRFPLDHPDPNLRGAFFETRRKIKSGQLQTRVRGIATSFGVRFLSAYLDSQNSGNAVKTVEVEQP